MRYAGRVTTRTRANVTRAALGLLLLVAFALGAVFGARPDSVRRTSAIVAALATKQGPSELRAAPPTKIVPGRQVLRRSELTAPVDLDTVLSADCASLAIADAVVVSVLAARVPARALLARLPLARPRSRAPPPLV